MLLVCLVAVSWLNPKVDSQLFAATVVAAVPLQHYQVDPVHQPLGLSIFLKFSLNEIESVRAEIKLCSYLDICYHMVFSV